jgi:hypothetical protein
MAINWQDLLTLGIVAAAAIYLARLMWVSILARKTSACGGCKSCSSHQKPADVFSIAPQRATDQTV